MLDTLTLPLALFAIALCIVLLRPLSSLDSFIRLLLRARKPFRRRAKKKLIAKPPALEPATATGNRGRFRRNMKKPEWVRNEVVRLALFMGRQGCRKIADTFNAIYAEHENPARRGETVSKTFVAKLITEREIEIIRQRRDQKHHIPVHLANDQVWGLDITFPPETFSSKGILGIIDHGSRVCLTLVEISSRHARIILRHILEAIVRHGRPKTIRTDNDGPFRSRLFQRVLRFLGIRHQRSRPMSPWENGRIERFFGTLKPFLLDWLKVSTNVMQTDLDIFRTWYNTVRTHHHLNGRTPAMARAGTVKFKPPVRMFSEWGGRLTGYVFAT